MTTPDTTAIQCLNDKFRQNLAGGTALITPSIAALGQEAVARIVQTIAAFDDFHHANDPHQEHDFGAFDVEAIRFFSRSTTTTMPSLTTRPTRPIRPSRSG